MKSFLEEYGFTILAAIVVILIIAMCTPIGNLIKQQVLNVVDSFAAKTESKLAAIDADAPVKVSLVQKAGETGFTITAESGSKNDTFKTEYRVKDQNGNWSAWSEATASTLSTGVFAHTGDFKADIENGNQIQVRVYDEAVDANLYYESNIVTYTGGTQAHA